MASSTEIEEAYNLRILQLSVNEKEMPAHTERHNGNVACGITCNIFKLKITQIYISGRMGFVRMMSCHTENYQIIAIGNNTGDPHQNNVQ